jgi:hypothetical protein
LKLWLLDADVVIDFLSLDVFDKLVKNHEIYVSSTVINEIKFIKKKGVKYEIDFRQQYVDNDLVKELSAASDDIKEILSKLPPIFHDTLDPGELESLAILCKKDELTFCSCDAAAIRALPFLDLSHRGVSAEILLKSSGLFKPGLKTRHTEKYFKDNLEIGKRDRIYKFEVP